MPLNESQARAVAITLRILEERLAMIDRILTSEDVGVLYRRPRPNFSAEQRERIDALIGTMRAEIASLAMGYGLAAEEQEPLRMIGGTLAITWQSLGEIQGRRLRAYGHLDPDVHATLDPAVERLMRLVHELEDAASSRTTAVADSGPRRAHRASTRA